MLFLVVSRVLLLYHCYKRIAITASRFLRKGGQDKHPDSKRERTREIETVMESPPVNDVCSVCHEDFNLPCQANCSHWFCGHCILRVWHHSSALQSCKCPICRRVITLLIPSEAAQHQRHDPEASRVLTQIENYNRLFGGGSRSFVQRLRDVPFFLRRLMRELMDPQRSLPLVFKARMIFAIVLSTIYVLSPVDIVPEAVFGFIGLLDDFLILLIVFLHVAAIYRSVLLYRHGGS